MLIFHNRWAPSISYGWFFLFFLIPFLFVLKVSLGISVFSVPPFTNLISWLAPPGSSSKTVFQLHLNFQNYITLFTDPIYIRAFLSSLHLAFLSTFFCLIFGGFLAYNIWQAPARLRISLLIFLMIPFWTSFLIRIYALMGLLSPKGIINTVLLKLHFIEHPISFLDTTFSVLLGMVYCYVPFMTLSIYSALEKIQPEWMEAAMDLGSSPFKTFLKVVVPLAKQGIFVGCALVFIPSFGEFVIPELLGGPKNFTLGRLIWDTFFHLRDWPLACAVASVLLIPFLLVMLGKYGIDRLKRQKRLS